MPNILIVDDESRIRRIYRKHLEQKGCEVFEASNVVDAREILKKETIDLILLDINMQDISGDILYEVSRCFHQKVLIIISSVFHIDDQKRLMDDATDYFDKSEGIAVLWNKIERALKNNRPIKDKQEVVS